MRAAKFVVRKSWIVTGSVSSSPLLSLQALVLLCSQATSTCSPPSWSQPLIKANTCTCTAVLQDDMLVRVFNYNTLEKVHSFEAHTDYLRSIIVHPTHPYILTSSGTSPSPLLLPRYYSFSHSSSPVSQRVSVKVQALSPTF